MGYPKLHTCVWLGETLGARWMSPLLFVRCQTLLPDLLRTGGLYAQVPQQTCATVRPGKPGIIPVSQLSMPLIVAARLKSEDAVVKHGIECLWVRLLFAFLAHSSLVPFVRAWASSTPPLCCSRARRATIYGVLRDRQQLPLRAQHSVSRAQIQSGLRVSVLHPADAVTRLQQLRVTSFSDVPYPGNIRWLS